MGNWNFNIQGVGAHHNQLPSDIDYLAAEFIASLADKGHKVEQATLTYGGKEDMTPKDMVTFLINGQPHKFERGSAVWVDQILRAAGVQQSDGIVVIDGEKTLELGPRDYILAVHHLEISVL